MQQCDTVRAKLEPRRRDNLKPGVEKWIGWVGIWEALWIIEDGEYKGQWAMGMKDFLKQDPLPPFVWVPLCDLVIINAPEDEAVLAEIQDR